MEFFDVINTRKTIRKYNLDTPPVEDIKRIIDAARLAPSATNRQNWQFIAIYNFELKTKMIEAIEETYNSLIEKANTEEQKSKLKTYKNYSMFLGAAPVVIAAIETPKQKFIEQTLSEMDFTQDEIAQMKPDSSILSLGAAIENISLAAHAMGYGTCWMCAPILAYKKLKEILNIPQENNLISLITLGSPFDSNTSRPLKKPLDDIMKIIK